MSRQQSGFTLIELIIVIVILGALAVVALPRFVDLQEEAEQAAVDGVAGNISSAFAVNFAGQLAGSGEGTVISDVTVEIDGDGRLSPDILTTADLGDYSIGDSGGSGTCEAPSGTGSTTTCTIESTEDDNASATFEVIATE